MVLGWSENEVFRPSQAMYVYIQLRAAGGGALNRQEGTLPAHRASILFYAYLLFLSKGALGNHICIINHFAILSYRFPLRVRVRLPRPRYTRSPLEDSRLFGPSPWKILAAAYEKDTSEQPSPRRKSSKRESCYGDRV